MFALGEMGLLPDQFYEMDIEDYNLKAEGFLDHKDWLEGSLRRIAAIIQSGIPYKNPPPSMLVQWPMRKDVDNKEKVKANSERNSVNTLAQFIRSAQGETPK